MEMEELEEDATDGQMADYFAAEESGDMGAWGVAVVGYECPSCGVNFETLGDTLKDYDELILGWHIKSKEGDCFSGYVFEYLSFVAWLKNIHFIGANTDREAIQVLKADGELEREYLQVIQSNDKLKAVWDEVIKELKREPLHNSSRDYDNPEIDGWWNNKVGKKNLRDLTPKGIVNSIEDWVNMVEYWYGVRNNLFHGGKDPNIKRDCFLVEHAFITLHEFMNLIINGKHIRGRQ
jgi:hypothetical protein